MKLECEDYYFYPDFEFISTHKWNQPLNCYVHDIQEISRAIRIFGKRNQIDSAFEAYSKASGLSLDECYDFKVEPKGSYWYKILKNADKTNAETKKKLKEYAEIYRENENKALIINLK